MKSIILALGLLGFGSAPWCAVNDNGTKACVYMTLYACEAELGGTWVACVPN